jgi:hypothetical protein
MMIWEIAVGMFVGQTMLLVVGAVLYLAAEQLYPLWVRWRARR